MLFTPGYDTEKMYFFLASELKLSKKRLPQDEDEEIKIRRMKLSLCFGKMPFRTNNRLQDYCCNYDDLENQKKRSPTPPPKGD